MPRWRLTARLFAILAMLAAGFLAAPVAAQERILDYDSRISVAPDASLTVTETIRVYAAGARIRRGIYRDFPTIYRDRLGFRVEVGFEVVEILRNGQREPFRIERAPNGKRIYIGDPSRFLPAGNYTYTITYRTTRQLGFFDEFDELYWNVTGTGWDFIIERARAAVILPDGARIRTAVAFTGRQGARERDYTSRIESDWRASFQTTGALREREGLTIAVAWQKGIVAAPGKTERLRWFLIDNFDFLIAGFGFLLLLFYYLIAWAAVGRDPPRGTIIPRFDAPRDLPPDAVRYLARMGYDKKCLAAGCMALGIGGYLRIESKGEKYTLVQQQREDSGVPGTLKGLLELIAKKTGRLVLSTANHADVKALLTRHEKNLEAALYRIYFRRNRLWIALGLTWIALVLFVAAGFADDFGEGLWTGAAAILGSALMVFFARLAFGTMVTRKPIDAGLAGVAALATGIGLLALSRVEGGLTIPALSTLGLIGVVHTLFNMWMPAVTQLGRRAMDEVEGLKLYMTVAERDRLPGAQFPERTTSLFEKLLPYALALDLEQEWSEKFADVIAKADAAGTPNQAAWRPTWYSGRDWDNDSVGSFASNFSSHVTGAISSSSVAPGSTSGSSGSFGGGGSSGGGGGGGGGGGW
ncbi:MAG: DUF2207 domain-containing protein [Alphaproteobacteria bacterium]